MLLNNTNIFKQKTRNLQYIHFAKNVGANTHVKLYDFLVQMHGVLKQLIAYIGRLLKIGGVYDLGCIYSVFFYDLMRAGLILVVD